MAEHFMGEEFTTNKPPTLDIKLIGTAPFAEVVIVKDNQYVYSTRPSTQTVEFQWTDVAARPDTTSYYFVRGLQVRKTQQRTVETPCLATITFPHERQLEFPVSGAGGGSPSDN